MKSIGIIGFGRFGELLADLSATYFDINIIESDATKSMLAMSKGYNILDISDIGQVDFVFLAVPISTLEEVLVIIKPLLKSTQVVIDLCSVKVYPATMMKRYISHAQLLASHPMFGPDSAKKGLAGLQVVLCPISIEPDNLRIINDFWSKLGTTVLTATPKEHDRDTAYSQAFTYSIAKLINGMDMPNITYRTKSFNDIYEVACLSAKDTNQLFHDMLFYNPYFIDMKAKLENSMDNTKAILDVIADEQLAVSKHKFPS